MIIDDKFRVASSLANDENTSDEEIIECLIESCPTMTPELIRQVVKAERDHFFLDMFYEIDWSIYS